MYKSNLLYLAFGLCLIAFVISGSSNGVADVQGVDRTGSPISLPSCISCHNSGNFGSTFTIEVLDKNSGNAISEYMPGTTYDVNFIVNTTTGNPQEYGFQSVALMGANLNAGIFLNPASNTELHTIANGRTYVEQLVSDPSNVFSVDWRAPAVGSGPVTFYGAGNAVNNNNATSGDEATVPISLQINEAVTCQAPDTLSSPVNDDDVVLTWNATAGATGYEIVGGPASSPNAVTLNVGAVTSQAVNNLTRNVTYVWKVRAICGSTNSPFSSTNQFFIPPIICDPPMNIASSVSGNSVTLSWSPSPNAIGYTINGGPIAAPTAVSLDVTGGATSSFTVNNLTPGGYAWRVRAVCAVSPSVVSAYSGFDQFNVVSPAQKLNQGLLGDADVHQAIEFELYPNPAKTFVKIDLTKVSAENVQVEFYDMNGRLIRTNQVLDGKDFMEINTGDLSRGIYQVVLRSNEWVSTERLIISD